MHFTVRNDWAMSRLFAAFSERVLFYLIYFFRTQPSQKQIKIRINVIKNEHFESFRGKKEALCTNGKIQFATLVIVDVSSP